MTVKFEKEILGNLKILPDGELTELLFYMGDTLPSKALDEFVTRGDKMIDYLWDVIAEEHNWRDFKDNGWWAVINATFILGAIGGERAIVPLIMSLRFSDIYDCDWIHEALPSIFGHIGPKAIEPLKRLAMDKSNNWFVRVTALDGIAAITIDSPKFEQEIFDFIASILNDLSEDMVVRGSAGSILLDFNKEKYKKSLLGFAKQDKELAEEDESYVHNFDEEDVGEAFKRGKYISLYKKYWLDFYSEKEILNRQKRWRKEAIEYSWWGFPYRWWNRIKFYRKIAKLEKEIKNKNYEKGK